MRQRGALVALFGLAGLAVACGEPGPPRGVVLVVVDTLRADHLGAYGYERPTSPEIDALAADAVLFEDAVAPAPWTLPSLATLMTSLYPSLHGAHSPSDLQDLGWYFQPGEFRAFSELHESRTTLAEVLRDAGFATFGAVQGSYPTAVFGMGQGFDVYHQNATPGFRFDLEDAFAWLDAEQPERFLVYLHVMEVHAPYTPIAIRPGASRKLDADRLPYFEEAVAEERLRFLQHDFDPDYRGPLEGTRSDLQRLSRAGTRAPPGAARHLAALYDRGIAYVDHFVGVLVDGLSERGLLDDVLLVVTADHGEEFLEHGRLEHSFSYYEEMLHVPLIVRVPGEGRGVRVKRSAGLVDVMPTILDVLAVSGPPDMQGQSLRPLWRGESLAPRAYLGEASFRPGDRALRADGFKYIQPGRSGDRPVNPVQARDQLYDLNADPDERTNLCGEDPDRCARYRDRLEARFAELAERSRALAMPEPAKIDDATREALEALGYLEEEEPEER